MILFVTTFTFLNLNNSAYATGYEGKSKFIGVDEETVNLKTSVKIIDNTVNYVINIIYSFILTNNKILTYS